MGERRKLCRKCSKAKPLSQFAGASFTCHDCSTIKACRRCKQRKPLTMYWVNDKSPDGHAAVCAECRRKQQKRAYWAEKERPVRPSDDPEWNNGEKVPLIDLGPGDPDGKGKVHICGNVLSFETVDGYGWMWCDRCGTSERFGR